MTFQESTAIAAVSLGEIYSLVDGASVDIFASNVRQYLQNTKINSAIRGTILQNPERFWLYNNGITIVCDDFTTRRNGIDIQSPQIVNGCQTAQSIWEVLSKKTKGDRETWPGHVLVRVIKGADEQQKEEIIRFTNTQNAVRGKDFFSLEEFQRKLQKRFGKLGYYYEIQRGSYIALRASEKAKFQGDPRLTYLVSTRFKNLIPAMEAVQAYTAGFKQLPAVAYGSSQQLTPTGTHYEQIFEDTLEPEPRWFLYPFLVRQWAKYNGYSRGGETWRAHSLFFFVYSYFFLVVQTLGVIEVIDSLESHPTHVPLSLWEKIFDQGDLNIHLLEMTNDILERYFYDSKVVEAVGLDVRKFLKVQDNIAHYQPVLKRQVELVLQSNRYRNVLNQLKEVLC